MTDDEVAVAVRDLEEVKTALGVALSYMEARDLSDAYRGLKQRSTSSPLTKMVERADGRVQGYLASTEESSDE